MARGRKYRRYSRRVSSGRGGAKIWIAIVAVLAFLALCLVISVMVGIALGKRAEDDGKMQLDLGTKEYYSGDKKIVSVNAYIYNGDFDVSRIWLGEKDFSLCLRDGEGRSAYSLLPGVSLEGYGVGENDLAEHVEYIKEYGGRVCAYMWVDLHSDKDPEMAELYRAYDVALAKYAAECGTDELVLILPEIDDGNVAAIEAYVNMISLSSGDMAVGVLMSSKMFLAVEEGVYHASRLRAVCDFAALDMRQIAADAVETELGIMSHYIKMYGLRLVFAEGQKEAIDVARRLGAQSIQTVKN